MLYVGKPCNVARIVRNPSDTPRNKDNLKSVSIGEKVSYWPLRKTALRIPISFFAMYHFFHKLPKLLRLHPSLIVYQLASFYPMAPCFYICHSFTAEQSQYLIIMVINFFMIQKESLNSFDKNLSFCKHSNLICQKTANHYQENCCPQPKDSKSTFELPPICLVITQSTGQNNREQ